MSLFNLKTCETINVNNVWFLIGTHKDENRYAFIITLFHYGIEIVFKKEPK